MLVDGYSLRAWKVGFRGFILMNDLHIPYVYFEVQHSAKFHLKDLDHDVLVFTLLKGGGC